MATYATMKQMIAAFDEGDIVEASLTVRPTDDAAMEALKAAAKMELGEWMAIRKAVVRLAAKLEKVSASAKDVELANAAERHLTRLREIVEAMHVLAARKKRKASGR